MSSIPGYLTCDDAAPIIGVSARQVSRYCQNGELKSVAIGNQYLIPEDAARSFVRRPRGNPNFREQSQQKTQRRKKT